MRMTAYTKVFSKVWPVALIITGTVYRLVNMLRHSGITRSNNLSIITAASSPDSVPMRHGTIATRNPWSTARHASPH